MIRRPSTGSLLFGLLGLAVGAAASVGAGTMRSAGTRRTPVVEAVLRASPAVVTISTDVASGYGHGASRGSGSGVLVHPGGYLVTNSHVVRDASRIVAETSKSSVG